MCMVGACVNACACACVHVYATNPTKTALPTIRSAFHVKRKICLRKHLASTRVGFQKDGFQKVGFHKVVSTRLGSIKLGSAKLDSSRGHRHELERCVWWLGWVGVVCNTVLFMEPDGYSHSSSANTSATQIIKFQNQIKEKCSCWEKPRGRTWDYLTPHSCNGISTVHPRG